MVRLVPLLQAKQPGLGFAVLTAATLSLAVSGVARGNPVSSGVLVDPPLSRYDRQEAKRRAVLRRVVRSRAALVNVTADITPATPELTWLGKKALPAFEWGLTNNTNAVVRQRLASVLHSFADPHSLQSLLVAARDWEQSVRVEVVHALGAIGSLKAESKLLELYRDPNESEFVRAEALRALGKIGSRKALGVVMKLLRDDKAGYVMQSAALDALWHLRFVVRGSVLRSGLSLALRKGFPAGLSVFAAGAAALLRERGLRSILEKRLAGGPLMVQNAAAYALGEIGDPRAIPALRRRLPTVRSTRLLNNILFALAKLKDGKRIALIESLLGSRQATIRLNVAFVAGDLKDPRLVPSLVKAASDSSRAVQVSAIQALAKIGDPRGLAVLDRAVGRGPADLSLMALKTLYRLHPRRYDQVLTSRYLRSPNGSTRCEAASILAQKGNRTALPVLFRCGKQFGFSWLKKRLRAYPAWTWEGFAVASAARAAMSGWGMAPMVSTFRGLHLEPGHLQVLRSLLPVTWKQAWTRMGLLQILGLQRDRKASPEIWRVARTRHIPTRYRAWFALANIGYRQGWQRLVSALTQAAPSMKRSLSFLLASLTNAGARKAVRGALTRVLQGHGVFTRLAAASALLAYEPSKGLPILLQGLVDRRQSVRAAAAFYLTRRSRRRFLSDLRKAEVAERDAVKRAAVRRIANRLDPHVFVPGLVRALPF